MRLQLGHALQDAAAGAFLPALDHHLAVTRIEGGDDPLARQPRQDFRPCGGAQDDLAGTFVEPGDRGLDIADAAADPGSEAGQQALDQGGVAALAHGGVEVDHRDLAGEREPLGDRCGIARVDRLLGAADELDGLAALQVDARDDHGRTLMPCSCR